MNIFLFQINETSMSAVVIDLIDEAKPRILFFNYINVQYSIQSYLQIVLYLIGDKVERNE